MIAGVGIDVCEIARMEDLLTEGRFLARFFSREEQAYIQSKGRAAAQTMAGLYAAKEALVKALGTGLQGMELKDIVVLHDSQGAPGYALGGAAEAAARARGIRTLHLSITHDGGVAAAVCIAERET